MSIELTGYGGGLSAAMVNNENQLRDSRLNGADNVVKEPAPVANKPEISTNLYHVKAGGSKSGAGLNTRVVHFSMETETEELVVQIIDPKTDKVLLELPAEPFPSQVQEPDADERIGQFINKSV